MGGLILLVGNMGVGKTTFADYLVKKYEFRKYSFAEPLKKAAKEIFLFTEKQLYGKEKDEIDPRLGVTPRKIFQTVGTELFRKDIANYIPELKIDPEKIWIERFKWWYSGFAINQDDVIIDDGRFVNEALEIKKMGGAIIKIIAPSDQFKVVYDHQSEKEIKNIIADYEIYNDIPENPIFKQEGLKKYYKKIDELFLLWK
jgi:hypothetical protein